VAAGLHGRAHLVEERREGAGRRTGLREGPAQLAQEGLPVGVAREVDGRDADEVTFAGLHPQQDGLGVGQPPEGLEPATRARCPWFHATREFGLECRDGKHDVHQVVPGEISKQIEVAENGVRLRHDGHGVTKLDHDFENGAGDNIAPAGIVGSMNFGVRRISMRSSAKSSNSPRCSTNSVTFRSSSR